LTAPSVWAVVVARTGPTAKSRLAPVLDVRQRERLAEAMLADVVSACVSAGLAGPVVVTEAPAARERFAGRGFPTPADAGTDMNDAARAGIAAAAAAGAGAVLVLPGDVPLASPADLITLTAWATHGATVVGVATDRSGQGTNALLLRPPDAIRPWFGPRSAERHRTLARRAGATVFVHRPPTLAFDVDTPADLTLLRRHRPGGETGALLDSLATAAAGAPGA
jgi:2-phospho-L-lactate/phosphoenolpyruvate guanylyltransferase